MGESSTARLRAAACGDAMGSELTFVEVFRASAALYPDKAALRQADQILTYGALDLLSDRLAAELRRRGGGRGQFIGLWMSPSLAMHAAILAILKTGAAYVPLHAGAPRERIDASLDDCGAKLLVVDAEIRARELEANGFPGVTVIPYEDLTKGAPGVLWGSESPQPSDPAYLLYTSGSTGRPKGIAVAHGSVCHFVKAENTVLGIGPDDVVWQGFSPAFDMSVEETFIAYSVGATLVIAPPDTNQRIDRLPAMLCEAQVTVLHAVPSLLAIIEPDVPSLRLINVGGEACPPAVVDRWWRPARRMFNTYGPTETTVSATAAELFPGRPVTIGRALPGYKTLILDDDLQPVRPGDTGELVIGGPGVALGYVNRPDLTAEKFVTLHHLDGYGTQRFYRTGDLVSLSSDGELIFHGRLDGQVKLRGYRVELGEIETVLCAEPGVLAAAATIRQDAGGVDRLVAFVVPAAGRELRPAMLREAAARRLPDYMIPARILPIESLPRLTSGKIDRKALPDCKDAEERIVEAPRNDTEALVIAALQRLFPGRTIDIRDNFFLDLGGHSLLAAKLVSDLRSTPAFSALPIAAIYERPTAESLAKWADDQRMREEMSASPPPAVSTLRRSVFAAAQAVGLLVVYAGLAAEIIVPYTIFAEAERMSGSLLAGVAAALAVFALLQPAVVLLAVAVKWLVIGRYRAGTYPLYGAYHWRWWFVRCVSALLPIQPLSGTPLYALYLRLRGARVGRHVNLATVTIDAEDLVAIGDEACLGNDVLLDNATIEDGRLILGRIVIGPHSHVGSRTVIGRDCRLGAWSELQDMACLSTGTAVADKEIWGGAPARRIGSVQATPVTRRPSDSRVKLFAAASAVLSLLIAMLALVPALPSMAAYNALSLATQHPGLAFAALSPLFAATYVLLFALGVVALRWLIQGRRLKEGTIPLYGLAHLRLWFLDQMMEMSLVVLHPVYATVYLPIFYRALGVRIGRRVEISTASSVTVDLLDIGDECFVGDGALLGGFDIRNGVITLRQTRLNKRSFIGNSAGVPQGTIVAEGAMVGVQTLAPGPEQPGMMPGSTWLGIPARLLPWRDRSAVAAEHLTYRPPPALVAARALVEGVRILLPATTILSLLPLLWTALDYVATICGSLGAVLATPLVYLGTMALPATAVVLTLKWLIIGRYREAVHPMWSRHVWFSEAITAAYEGLVAPLLAEPLEGTVFLSVLLRLFGARIGHSVLLHTTDFTEFDMVEIGDGAVLEDDSGPQTHLFEDRMLKIGRVRVGRHAELSARAIALYDTVLEDGVRLGPQSLVMKGERLPAHSSWTGSPVVPQPARTSRQSPQRDQPGRTGAPAGWPGIGRPSSRPGVPLGQRVV